MSQMNARHDNVIEYDFTGTCHICELLLDTKYYRFFQIACHCTGLNKSYSLKYGKFFEERICFAII